MALFKRTKKDADAKAPAEEPKKKAPAKTKKTTDETSSEVKVVSSDAKAAKFAGTLLSPRVSEKAAILAHKGVYVFNVPVKSNKIEIKKAIEAFFKVNVTNVRTVRGIGKIVRRGRTAGARNNWKKALVTLKAGQKIDVYEGV
ncbi:MAG: 50S ribosomal protein L23 [Patescibacteria group bacterium]